MNYPTVKEQALFRSILKNAADIADTIDHADGSGWVVDSTELLEYVLAEANNLNDALLGLIMGQVKEDEDNGDKDQD